MRDDNNSNLFLGGSVMATFRMIQTSFWEDPKVGEELTPEDKLFFLYLLTNPYTTQIGIYQITKSRMAFDLGYSLTTIEGLMERFVHQHRLIRYNAKTREIAIKHWGRYNLKRGGKPMLDCIAAELKKVKDRTFIAYVGEHVSNHSIKELFNAYTNTDWDEEKETGHKEIAQTGLEVREQFIDPKCSHLSRNSKSSLLLSWKSILDPQTIFLMLKKFNCPIFFLVKLLLQYRSFFSIILGTRGSPPLLLPFKFSGKTY